MARELAYVNPIMIVWARESSAMSIEEAAHKLQVKDEKLLAWEEGRDFPTLVQARKLSKVYRRAFSLFYLPEPPSGYMPVQDFRANPSQNYSTPLTFLIRELQEKQEWVKDFLQDEGKDPLEFVGRYSSESSVYEVVEDIKNTLSFDGYPSVDHLKYWIEKAESAGIYVSRTSNLHSRAVFSIDDFRGFALPDKFAPFVFINSKDSKAAQLFTLIHELAHLWLGSTALSDSIDISFRDDQTSFDPVEVFCNQVAATLLMPEDVIYKWLGNVEQIDDPQVLSTAKNLGVSKLALVTRMRNLEMINHSKYEDWREIMYQEYQEFLKQKEEKQQLQKGAPSCYLLQAIKNGAAFSRLVISSMNAELISRSQASSLLGIKLNNLHEYTQRVTV